jgi:glycosyltransferase involved in cell wall biosynthesis
VVSESGGGNAPTKILHIMTAPQSLFQFLRGQVEYVRAQGFEIHASASPGEWMAKFTERDHVPLHPVDIPRSINPVKDVIAMYRLFRVIQWVQPDIVQSGTPQAGMFGTIAAWLARTPVRIYHIRGLPFMTSSGKKRTLLRWTEKVSCRLAHKVLCVSHSIREVAIAEGICPAEKIVVLKGGSGNGVDADGMFNPRNVPEELRATTRRELGIPENALVLGFIGRLVHIKGISELAGVWSMLRDRYPELHLIVVGPFEDHDPIPDDVARALIDDPRVHLTERVVNPVPYYAAIDVVILPTYREGLPNVLLEAAAMEIPVVATRIPGCIDVVVDGSTGTLVPVKNVEALAEAVKCYLDDPALRRRHGGAARERVLREFKQEAIWEALVQEYGRLLAKHGRSVPRRVQSMIDDAEIVEIGPALGQQRVAQ